MILLWILFAVALALIIKSAIAALFYDTPSAGYTTASYLANKHSHIFHRAGCKTVKYSNAACYVGYDSRNDCIAAGFIPCKVCQP